MQKKGKLLVVGLVIFCLLGIYQSGYTWPGIDPNGVSICTASEAQDRQQIISDNQGGAIITWEDDRNGNSDIYTQAINGVGMVKWTANGVSICTASSDQSEPQLVSDGHGGAIITWYDRRSSDSDIYVQAINSTGGVKWTSNGIAICTSFDDQRYPKLVSDGQGGAIISWHDVRSGSYDIYAQAIDSAGGVKWTTNGVAICTASDSQIYPQLIPDGQGGAIISWQDNRNGNNYDIYAQAIDSSGSVKWTLNGVAICTVVDAQYTPQLVSDGQGGAIITWEDQRNGNWDIYTQAINSAGSVKWTANGVPICTASDLQNYPKLISDGHGGAIITWFDNRSLSNDIYAQAIDITGSVKWTANGVPICTYFNYQGTPNIVPDGRGGAIITWYDRRISDENIDIYAQAIDSTGIIQWTLDGASVCTASGVQHYPQLVSDGQSGAIITWQDNRDGNWDVYAQSIDEYGRVSGPLMTRLVDLKLFKNESHISAFNMPDQFAGETVNNFSIVDNFLALCSINGNNISQDAYSLTTTGINRFFVSGSFGILTSDNAVKYSSYKLNKLPYIGITPGTYQDFPVYQYAFYSFGSIIPESFGHAAALTVSDTTKISAVWLNSSTIRITAQINFSGSGYVDIIASPVTNKPFGLDMDRERLFIFPSLLTTAGFTNATDTSIFSYQKAQDRSVLATVTQISTSTDVNGNTAFGVMKIDFANGSSGMKATLIPSQWKDYKTAQWYTVRMRMFSPNIGNQHQALLYQYDNPVTPGSHVDIGGYVCFGIPTVWSWIEQSLYCRQSGSGYPQLLFKAASTGSVYIDEIQIINQTPEVLGNLRNPANLKYAYGQFTLASETSGWGYQPLIGASAPTIIPPINVNGGILGFDFRGADSGDHLMGVKATATNGVPSGIYTPENLPNAEIGMKMDFIRYFGHATTANALIAMYMFGVQTSGQFEIAKPPSELIAIGEFGPLKNGTHWVIGKALSRYHQFQFMLKNDTDSILTLDNIEMFQDRDSDEYGDSSLFP